jgi:hypothetical protein
MDPTPSLLPWTRRVLSAKELEVLQRAGFSQFGDSAHLFQETVKDGPEPTTNFVMGCILKDVVNELEAKIGMYVSFYIASSANLTGNNNRALWSS